MRPPYDLDHVFLPKFIAVSLLQLKMNLIGERHLRGSSKYLLWEVAHLEKGTVQLILRPVRSTPAIFNLVSSLIFKVRLSTTLTKALPTLDFNPSTFIASNLCSTDHNSSYSNRSQ